MSDAALLLDTHGRILGANEGAVRLFALNSQFHGKCLDELHQIQWPHPADEQAAQQHLATQGHWCGVTLHRLQGRPERCIESSIDLVRSEAGLAVGWIVLLRDITERRRLEEALRESEHRLQLAQRVAQIGWFDWDIRSDTSVSSDEAQALHGLRPGSFRGGFKEWRRLVHPDDLAGVEQGVADSLRQGGEHSHLHRVIWPDGSVHWLRTRLRVFSDEHGDSYRMVGVMVDVTDLKQAEELATLKSHELEGRVATRTAAMQESIQQLEAFVYSVSHDLRAPLRALEGFAQAVLDDDGERLCAGSRDALERIRKAALRMDALTTDLVDYTRLERAALPPGTVSLSAVVEEVTLSLQKAIEQRRAQLSVEQPLPPVRGHEKTVAVVVGHLLSNALKFVREGVRPEVRIWAEAAGEVVRLSVQDNGIGIAPAYHERIFRVFERLHGMEDYSGTGIGLAVVRKAVQRMGGRVGVRSEPGQGSCFWIELPAGEAF